MTSFFDESLTTLSPAPAPLLCPAVSAIARDVDFELERVAVVDPVDQAAVELDYFRAELGSLRRAAGTSCR